MKKIQHSGRLSNYLFVKELVRTWTVRLVIYLDQEEFSLNRRLLAAIVELEVIFHAAALTETSQIPIEHSGPTHGHTKGRSLGKYLVYYVDAGTDIK